MRLSEKDRASFLQEGAKPFEPMSGRVMSEYVVVPQTILDLDAQINEWLEKAFACEKSLPPKTKKAKGKRVVKKWNIVQSSVA